jgi:hypothetical protein
MRAENNYSKYIKDPVHRGRERETGIETETETEGRREGERGF